MREKKEKKGERRENLLLLRPIINQRTEKYACKIKFFFLIIFLKVTLDELRNTFCFFSHLNPPTPLPPPSNISSLHHPTKHLLRKNPRKK